MLLKPIVSATNTEAFQYGDLLASKDIMSNYVQIITATQIFTHTANGLLASKAVNC